jgi:Icc-related predicted phosphoesterase
MGLACSELKNLVFFHKKAEIINNTLFLGFGGGGFEQSSPEMERFFKKHRKKFKTAEKAVFITHAPPYKTKLDQLNSSHQGNNTLRNLIIKHQPVLAISGHFHENSGKSDVLGMSKIINPGPFGEFLKI